MKSIEASLPSLGSYSVPFFKESEEVIITFPNDLSRLDNVQHLGVASKVFTGVNHSRLEYTLLQCALINLLTKFQKGEENFAISSKVKIDKKSSAISSAEELLKSWALLSNFGHAQYTYGTERALLNYARQHDTFKQIITNGLPRKLQKWSLKAIENYRDEEFHYILILRKISYLPEKSRLKAKLYRIMAALLLPIEELSLESRADYFKLFRLRRLYSQLRLLSIVSLDSYYSHHPVRLQVGAALMNIGNLIDETESQSEFLVLIRKTAAWLADELYMHPKAAAAQKFYEIQAEEKLNSELVHITQSQIEFDTYFNQLLQSGLGTPNTEALGHLSRLSLPISKFRQALGKDQYSLRKSFEHNLNSLGTTHVSVLTNFFSGMVHFDLLYSPKNSSSNSIALTYTHGYRWLSRLLEAQSLSMIRNLRMPEEIDKSILDRIRIMRLEELVKLCYPAFKSIFNGLVTYMLPENLKGFMSEVILQRGQNAIGIIFNYARGGRYDSISKQLDDLINKPNDLSEDRINELKALKYKIEKSKAPFILVCFEKFVIKDPNDEKGRHVDEWDGVLIEIYDDKLLFSIIEAKNLKHKKQNENKAFIQLGDTKTRIHKKHKLTYARRRIPGLGAALTFTL